MLFGPFQLRQADESDIMISNKRARAVLAMLCVEQDTPLDRSYLSKVLWPGRFEAHAKASLRQSLLELAKLHAPCGANIVAITRNNVALNRNVLRTDLDELEALFESGDYAAGAERLATIGTRPILDQMGFGDAFNEWLSRARVESERRLCTAVETALAELDAQGDTEMHARLLAAWSARDPDAKPVANPVVADRKTRIAILPFRSMGSIDGADYFADGMADELITALGQVPQLLVAGRTSSFHFRDSALLPGQIAGELGVTHLIEGSVHRQGEQVRTHVHLIDGVSGFELWAERFDGNLDDVFAFQEQVAQAITAAIGSALGIAMQVPRVHGMTHSKEAYDLYLQGRALHARVFGDNVLLRAAELLDQATMLDPNFAEAWLLLADVHQRMGIYLAGTDQEMASANMADCVRKAMAIKPTLGMPYGLLSLHELTQNNFVGALDLAFKGYEVEPNNPAVAVRIGGLLLFCGLTRQGMRYLDEAVDRDPVDGRNYMVRSAGQLNLGNIDAAIADAQRAVDLGFPSVWLGVALAAAGNHDAAIEAYQQTRFMLKNSVPPPTGIAPMSPEMLEAYWLVAAKGVCSGVPEDREIYCRTLDFLYATMVEKDHLVITLPAVFMGYTDLLFKTIGSRITLSNMACMISIWADIDPIRQIWQHEEFIPFAQRIGMADAWDKYGWPDLLPVPSNRRG
jgi:TolB-like protein